MAFFKKGREVTGSLFFLSIIFLSRAYGSEQVMPYFSHLTRESGLSHNKVNCILQDRRGFIWLGTEDGLNRYDGKYYTVFNTLPGDSTSISGNIVTDLLEDKDGSLWIATADGGLTHYDYRLAPNRQFKQFKHRSNDPRSIPDNNIGRLVMDDQGYLWMITATHSIIRFDKKTGVFDSPVKDGPLNITSICMDNQGIIWAATLGEGLLKVNTHTLQHTMDHGSSFESMTGIFEDSKKNIWYGQPNRLLHCYAEPTGSDMVFKNTAERRNVPEDEILCFAEDKMGHVWMGGRYSGVYVYDRESEKFAHFWQDPLMDGSLVDNHINCVYIDRSGIIWIGTNKGVSFYNPLFEPFVQTFLPVDKNNVEIFDFYKDTIDKSLWIATSDGIFIQKAGEESFEHRRLSYKGTPLAVTKFFRDNDGTFYLGTDYSIFIYDRRHNQLSPLPERDPGSGSGIGYARIFGIKRDTVGGKPVMAVASRGRPIFYYDWETKKWQQGPYLQADNRVGADKLWGFSTGIGWKGWQIAKRTMPGTMLYDVQEDKNGNLWISTYGNGLNFYDATAKTISHIKMSSNLTEGIQPDEKGNIWMICNGHLHKYDPSNQAYSCYDLPSAKRNGIKGYMYKDNQDNMYAAGMNYYITFRPETVEAINMEPQVWLTDFKINNRSNGQLLENRVISLRHDQNFFSIEFSAPEFSGDNLDYSYMLEGADKEWIESDKRNYASYSDLPAGEYVFRVKATNWRGCDSDKVTMIQIMISPPVWRTWWFYLLSVLLVGGIFYAIYRYRIREYLKRQAIRNRIALDLHDNIGATLSSISIYSQVARVYQDQHDGRQLRDVLDRIDKTAGEAINEMSDMVWAINPKNDHILSIIARMKTYAEPLCVAKSVTFEFNDNARVEKLNLEMIQRKNLYLIFKEVVNNALKYSGCTHIEVELVLENFIFRMRIKDNGKGFDIKALRDGKIKSLSGNGLFNIERRANEMKADLTVDSQPGVGTTVELSLRVN
ncbi:MAG: histidine kinase [Bacteroidetes bacterium]|nr:histidine kinase [Bacteroidota bacterium]